MIWKNLKGYDHYKISSTGLIKTTDGKYAGKILTEKISRNKYMSNNLRINGKKVSRFIHRLVYESFVGPIPDGMCINHIDGNKMNNKPSNLEIVTPKQNTHHAIRTGLISQKGTESCNAVLNNKDIKIIRAARGKIHQKLLAKSFGVTQAHISAIQTNKKWRHIK